jgi:hypothetical protein
LRDSPDVIDNLSKRFILRLFAFTPRGPAPRPTARAGVKR